MKVAIFYMIFDDFQLKAGNYQMKVATFYMIFDDFQLSVHNYQKKSSDFPSENGKLKLPVTFRFLITNPSNAIPTHIEITNFRKVSAISKIFLRRDRNSQPSGKAHIMFGKNKLITKTKSFMKKRVKIPAGNPTRLLDLAKKVQLKHVADGENSPLKVLNWAAHGPIIDQVLQDHEKAERLKREMLETYQRRDLNLPIIVDLLRNSRDILAGTFGKEMKKLGQWGYSVLEAKTESPPNTETK
jgi:hypothetical protein